MSRTASASGLPDRNGKHIADPDSGFRWLASAPKSSVALRWLGEQCCDDVGVHVHDVIADLAFPDALLNDCAGRRSGGWQVVVIGVSPPYSSGGIGRMAIFSQ